MKVYIGIDMGWKGFRYEVRDGVGRKIKMGGGVSTPEGLREVLQDYTKYPRVQVAYEAGAQMYWIDEVVKDVGMDSYAFHAADFALSVKSKNKTDKKDAEKIAKAAGKENLPPRVVVPPEAERALREQVKERKRWQKELSQGVNRLRALGIQLGFTLAKRGLREKMENWDGALSRFQGTRYEKQAQRLYRQALVCFQLLEEVEEEWRASGNREEWREAREQLDSIPGIGEQIALALIAWCGPQAARFANSRHAASYFGLTGGVYESGSIHRERGVTKCGPPLVRSLMVQAAWAFLRSKAGRQSPWGEWFRKRTDTRNKSQRKKAVVGLARKILTAAVACLQNGTRWDAGVLQKAHSH